tara:strand:- start:1065 stop:1268 length:204 start_codon:yes stop_codon:yes gene_type:complete
MSKELEELNESIEALVEDMEKLQVKIENLSRGNLRNKLMRLQRKQSSMLHRLLEELSEHEGGDLVRD